MTQTLRRCNLCKEEKVLDNFHRNRSHPLGHGYRCKPCMKEVSKKYQKNNLEKFREANARQRKKKREAVYEYLHEHPCVDCGEGDPIVLEFDHVRDVKKANVMDLVRRSAPLKKIFSEIQKCEVRCANCHRRKTVDTLGVYRADA